MCEIGGPAQQIFCNNYGQFSINNFNGYQECNNCLDAMSSNSRSPLNNFQMAPQIIIIEQPQKAFRFRYESEHGQHGSLMGEKNTKKNKSLPKIKVIGCCKGKVRIRGTLFVKDDKKGILMPHVHKLQGKNCNPQGIFEIEKDISSRDAIIDLAGMSIGHVAKKNIESILTEKYLEKLKQSKHKLYQTGLWTEDDITEHDKQHAAAKAEEDKKVLLPRLNEVVIKFEAELFLEKSGTWVEMCPPEYSHTIKNRKAANTGDLVISKLHLCSGFVSGGEEVIILCGKVEKKNIQVRFFELNADDDVEWEANGILDEFSVHHQYAILFKTPPYRNNKITVPVDVYVQLYRPSDQCASESVVFEYRPIEEVGVAFKKRKMFQPSDESSQHRFANPNINSCPTSEGKRTDALKLEIKQDSTGSFGASCSEATGSQTAEILQLAHQLQNEYEVSKSSQQYTMEEFESKISEFGVLLTTETLPTIDEGNSSQGSESVYTDLNAMEPSYSFQQNTVSLMPSTSGQDYQQHQQNLLTVLTKSDDPMLCPSTTASAPLPYYLQINEGWNIGEDSEDDLRLHSRGFDDLVADGPSKVTADSKKLDKENEKGREDKQVQQLYFLAVNTAVSLQDYSKTNDVVCLLKNMRHLVSYIDENGDNALHLAVIHSQRDVLKHLLELKSEDPFVINATNDLNQTPLHIAIYNDDIETVRLLITNGADPNIKGREGNTAFHIAAERGKEAILRVLLTYKLQDINKHNKFGLTPLHLAVIANSLPCVKELYNAKANFDEEERMSGRTALHIAVENLNIPIIEYLLDHGADIDAQMFDGYTPLHLAVVFKSEEIVKLLLEHNADKYIQTVVTDGPETSDEERLSDDATVSLENNAAVEDEQDDHTGYTSVDLARDNEKIRQILLEIPLSDEMKTTNTEQIRNKVARQTDGDSGISLSGAVSKYSDEDSALGLSGDVVESTKEKSSYTASKQISKPSVALDSGVCLSKNEIEEMGDDVRNSLYRILNRPGDTNWKKLSVCLGLDYLIDQIEEEDNPTESLLSHLETLNELRHGLEAMVCEEGLQIVDRYAFSKGKDVQQTRVDLMNEVSSQMGKMIIK